MYQSAQSLPDESGPLRYMKGSMHCMYSCNISFGFILLSESFILKINFICRSPRKIIWKVNAEITSITNEVSESPFFT